jgi:LmbE family N-acetylglucosaminyl deacetylase
MKQFILFATLITLSTNALWSQSPEQPKRPTSAEIFQNLKQFSNTAKVLYLAAHPDDENTRVIAYLEKYRNVETAYLSLTRGDGGQNLIGTDIGQYLGVLRTQELLNARKKDGGQQFFTRAVDFGYSKNPEETFKHWNRDSILKDVVFTIRHFKPDVIICRFPTTGEGGHGHHTASAMLAEEAFDLASNKDYNTGQKTHKVNRLLWNSYSWGRGEEALKDDIKIDMGKFLPELGKYVGEIASDARSQHRCQGFGRPLQRGNYSEYFKNIKGSKISKDLLENIPTDWNTIDPSGRITNLINAVILNYSFQTPSQSVIGLQIIERAIEALPDFTGKEAKLTELRHIILQASGFYAEWTTRETTVTANNKFTTNFEYSAASNLVKHISYQCLETSSEKFLTAGVRYSDAIDLVINSNLFKEKQSDVLHLKSIQNDIFLNTTALGIVADNRKNDLRASIELSINGKKYFTKIPLISKKIAPDYGEKYNRLLILPTVSFNIVENKKIIKKGEWNTITVNINNRGKSGEFELFITANDLEIDAPKKLVLSANKMSSVSFKIKGTQKGKINMVLALKNSATGNMYYQNERPISYDHIPALVNTNVAEIELNVLDIKQHDLKIAYLTGAGDLLANNLKNIGLKVDVFSEEELLNFDPKSYDAVVAGIRIYNVSENIGKIQDKLNKYVFDGGTYIVQYNTRNFLGAPNSSFSPLPMKIGRSRVTVETQPVKVLNPKHFAFNTPYTISDDSWNNWVQERGLYFGGTWDAAFEPLLEMADEGEDPSQGSLLYLHHGKGHFYYSGISFFRNMPAGVEGAYQLFINLLSSSKQTK